MIDFIERYKSNSILKLIEAQQLNSLHNGQLAEFRFSC